MSKNNNGANPTPSIEELERRTRLLELASNPPPRSATGNNESQQDQANANVEDTRQMLDNAFRRYLNDNETSALHAQQQQAEPMDDATRRRRLLSVLERAIDILNEDGGEQQDDAGVEEHKQLSNSNHGSDDSVDEHQGHHQ